MQEHELEHHFGFLGDQNQEHKGRPLSELATAAGIKPEFLNFK